MRFPLVAMQILSMDSKLIYDFFVKPEEKISPAFKKLLSFLESEELNYTLSGSIGLSRILPENNDILNSVTGWRNSSHFLIH